MSGAKGLVAPRATPRPAWPRAAMLAAWSCVAVAVFLVPAVWGSPVALTTMSLMGIMVIFALSYNMLLGQTGLLSFGHAVLFGLGGFLTIHAMNAVENARLAVPLAVFPLVGAIGGLAFGAVFGALATRRAGTAFAMITLGIGELVASSALILHGFFGGEGGISTDRTDLVHPLGITFGPQLQVYELIAAWCLVSTVAMYALTRTPFGRMCNAVRDNPDRVPFLGYSSERVRFLAFALSGLFAGVAGGLDAIDFELMSSTQLGGTQSGVVILMAYIGGIGQFMGPAIGAIVVTYLQLTLSNLTDAWQLYLGLLFVGVVMFAPEGIAGLLARQRPLLQARQLHRVLPFYAIALPPALAALLGLSLLIQMTDQLTVDAASGSSIVFFDVAVDAARPWPWLIALLLLLGGGALFLRAARATSRAYGDAIGLAHLHREEA